LNFGSAFVSDVFAGGKLVVECSRLASVKVAAQLNSMDKKSNHQKQTSACQAPDFQQQLDWNAG
jgi:hypothetical protein